MLLTEVIPGGITVAIGNTSGQNVLGQCSAGIGCSKAVVAVREVDILFVCIPFITEKSATGPGIWQSPQTPVVEFIIATKAVIKTAQLIIFIVVFNTQFLPVFPVQATRR